MLLERLFQPFVEKRPVCILARGVLERVLDPKRIDRLFADTAERQYTRNLLFSTLVDLLSHVVLGWQPSVHAAYQHFADQLPVSDQAVYDQLQQVEPAVAAALVHDAARRLRPVIELLGATFDSWLPGYRIKILDGNHLAATEHRLEESRHTWAAPLPGKALAVLDQQTMLVTNVCLAEDGQAQERSLLDGIWPLVDAGDLWLADRNFCTLELLTTVAARSAAFVVRQHGTLKGEFLGRRVAKGRCDTGQVFEQKLRVRHEKQVLVVRRGTVVLDEPTRDGDTEIHVLTNLSAAAATARQVADWYRQRWTIEGLFLEVAQTLDCEIKTLAYPQGGVAGVVLGVGGLQRGGVAEGGVACGAWCGGGERIVGLLSGVGDSPDLRRHAGGDSGGTLGGVWQFQRRATGTGAEGVGPESVVAALSQTSAWSQKEAAPTHQVPPRRTCGDSKSYCRSQK